MGWAECFFCFEALPAFTKAVFCLKPQGVLKTRFAHTKEPALYRRTPVFGSCGASANEENSCHPTLLLPALSSTSQADIRNPLRYLLITECCFAAYQEWLAPLLIQASPNPLLIALRN